MPYSQAVRKDKRNIFQIFLSVTFIKVDLINLFIGDEKFKEILICEYITSLCNNLFFNTLLYSDEIVTRKYHNDGELGFVVTITITLLSNILTSIITYFMEISELLEERLEQIIEIKNENEFLKILEKLLKRFNLKILISFILRMLIICIYFIYIAVFCIIYKKSQTSLLMNYLTSLLEDLIKALIVSVIVVISRKIGISCLNRYIYNTSKYINEHF